MTVLAKASSNLTDPLTDRPTDRPEFWKLPETSDCKILSWATWSSESRITVLARASSNLAVSQSSYRVRGIATWLSVSSDRKTWSRVPRDSEPRISVLARPSRNLPDRLTKRDSCTNPRVVRQKNTVMNPTGLGTKNYCAGEGYSLVGKVTDYGQDGPGPTPDRARFSLLQCPHWLRVPSSLISNGYRGPFPRG
jgi:hypothetical protein